MKSSYETVEENVRLLHELVEELIPFARKFDGGERGYKGAGTVVTKGMQNVKKQAQDIRKQVFAEKEGS